MNETNRIFDETAMRDSAEYRTFRLRSDIQWLGFLRSKELITFAEFAAARSRAIQENYAYGVGEE